MTEKEKEKIAGLAIEAGLAIAERLIVKALEMKVNNAIAAGGQYNPAEVTALVKALEAVCNATSASSEINSPYSQLVKDISAEVESLVGIMEATACET